jgi:hypothetical protein
MKAEVDSFVHLASPQEANITFRRSSSSFSPPPLFEIMPLVSWFDAGNCGQKR